MDPKRVTRKLRAILSADVQGYSRLMGDDEVATFKTITEYREIFSSIVTQYNGRVVDSPGDNILSEFASVVDAVQCAVEIQKVLKAKNEELPENRRMIFRIGVNLGDVIHEDDRIYGDGVNIASRIESLADGGGICISGTAYDHIENKLALGYNFMGEHPVKNIAKPIRVYKVPMEPGGTSKKEEPKLAKNAAIAVAIVMILGIAAVAIWNFYLRNSLPSIEPASVEKMALPLPDKPSIAVLPFDNLSGDREQEYIADGITENIINALSKISEIFVIARNSASIYKGKPVKVQKVSEELGVRYVLEGSIQKSEDRIRVSVQLIDAIKGHHLWSEQYDRNLKDLFALQDDITKKIVVALQVELTDGEQARLRHRTTNNLKAWGYAVKGYSLFERYNKADNAKARELFEKALKLDPDYAWAWTWLAWTYWVDARFGFSHSRAESFKRSIEVARKAVALDESDPDVHALLGWIYLYQREYKKALAEGKKAVLLGPHNAEVHALLAMTMVHVGGFEEAILLSNRAMRLTPFYPSWYLLPLASSNLLLGQYEKSIEASKKCLERAKNEDGVTLIISRCFLIAAYIILGRKGEAHSQVEEILKVNPKLSLEWIRKALLWKNPEQLQSLIDDLRKAGIPKKPPLPLPDKPSIAVLPFDNMSADPEQEYFSDGLTEDIITDLSKISGLFVIARNSAFTYKGKPTKIEQVSRELGVRYVLEGSVRKVGNEVRINAQLIDGTTGGHLWADRYDGKMEDIFSLQDKINNEIVSALKLKLTADEQNNISQKQTSNVEAYDYYLRGKEFLRSTNRESVEQAKAMFKKAIELDPDFAPACIGVARANLTWLRVGHADLRKEAGEFITRALAIDGSLPEAHAILALLRANDLHFEEAIASAAKAVELDPNNANSYVAQAYVLTMAGKHKDALKAINAAFRMNPKPPPDYEYTLALVQFNRRQYAKAIASIKKAIASAPNFKPPLRLSIASHAYLGLTDKAGADLKEYLKSFPWYSLAFLRDFSTYKLEKDTDHYIRGMEMAGMPRNAFGYRFSEDNKLTIEEMKALLTGRKISGANKTGDWWILHNKDGEMFSGGSSWGKDRGTYWFEDDKYWNKWEKIRQGRICSAVIIRNPKGTRERRDEYIFLINGIPFTLSPEE